MNPMDRSFDPTVFTKNRNRLLEHRTGQALFGEVGVEPDRQGLLSAEHFRVDGTQIESAAGIESASVLDFVKSGPPPRTVDTTVFEMWLGSLSTHQDLSIPVV